MSSILRDDGSYVGDLAMSAQELLARPLSRPGEPVAANYIPDSLVRQEADFIESQNRINEATLRKTPEFIESAWTLWDYAKEDDPGLADIENDEQAVDWLVNELSAFNNSLMWAGINAAKLRKAPLYRVKTFANALYMYDQTDENYSTDIREPSLEAVGRGLYHAATDPFSWVGLTTIMGAAGYGLAKSQAKNWLVEIAKAGMRSKAGRLMQRPVALGVVEGAAMGGAFGAAEETIQARADNREFDSTAPMVYAGIGAGMGAAFTGGAAGLGLLYDLGRQRFKLYRAHNEPDPWASQHRMFSASTDPDNAMLYGDNLTEFELMSDAMAELPESVDAADLINTFQLDEDTAARLSVEMGDEAMPTHSAINTDTFSEWVQGKYDAIAYPQNGGVTVSVPYKRQLGAVGDLSKIAQSKPVQAADPLKSQRGYAGGQAPRTQAAARRPSIKANEKDALLAGRRNVAARTVLNRARDIRSNYPAADGWAPIEFTGVEWKDGKWSVKVKNIPYAFHNPPAGMTSEQWASTLAERGVAEIQKVVNRAKTGDKDAQAVIDQWSWYQDMRKSLRRDFGGMGDLFADLLGTTSAITGVELNWRNASTILKKYSRGDYDRAIAEYRNALKAGMSETEMTRAFKAGEMAALTGDAGKLFGTNSFSSTGALLDMFRQMKEGGAPKTPNFTGNLIGYSDRATIDVWAARFLRRLAGLKRIPAAAEGAVSGGHNKGSTLEDPKIGAEFGFGQDVFAAITSALNDGQVLPGEMIDADVQAVAWFLEKEIWTNNGWTNKAGEGGSLDYESSLAGTSKPERVRELRRGLNKSFKNLRRRKKETDEDYLKRNQAAMEAYEQKQVDMQQELDELAAPLSRTLVGISAERPNARPSNYQQAELAASLDDSVRDNPQVMGYKLNSTFGRFDGANERALDAEFVTAQNFNPAELTTRVVELGKELDQDAVFVSRVLPEATDKSVPGVEVYFSTRQSDQYAEQLSNWIADSGIDGFTFITDARQHDRVNVQVGTSADTAGFTGLRFQYLPEYDPQFNGSNLAERVAEMESIYRSIANEILERNSEVAVVNVVHYDTQLYQRGDYDGYLERAGRSGPQGVRSTGSNRQADGGSAARTEQRPIDPGTLPDRVSSQEVTPGGEQ